MKNLSNYATVNGIYDNLNLEIESDTTTVSLVNNINIIKKANKNKWANGNLTYTINLKNNSNTILNQAIVTDILNPNLITLVSNSLQINGITGAFGDYTYDSNTGLLTIFLTNIFPNQEYNITFQVSKKAHEVFKLTNIASLNIEGMIFNSNLVTTIALSDICCNN